METALNKCLMWKEMDGREQRAELRGHPVSSRIRLSYSFPDTCKVHKISHFAPVPELHNFSVTHSNYLIPIAMTFPFSLWLLIYLTILLAGILVFSVKENF